LKSDDQKVAFCGEIGGPTLTRTCFITVETLPLFNLARSQIVILPAHSN
jgi:hypothetical protein